MLSAPANGRPEGALPLRRLARNNILIPSEKGNKTPESNSPLGRSRELLDVTGAWILTGWNHRPGCFGYEQASLDLSDLQSGVALTC